MLLSFIVYCIFIIFMDYVMDINVWDIVLMRDVERVERVEGYNLLKKEIINLFVCIVNGVVFYL